jgi:hypothetical protein
MAAEDVAQALMALDGDPDVRRRVADGDFEALGDLALTADEQRLVSEATPMLPDGHPTKVLVPVGSQKAPENTGYWPAGTARAIQYIQGELVDPSAQARFDSWQLARADRYP